MKKSHTITESDIVRGRLVILDYMIDELINMNQDVKMHPIDRVASIQLAGDLETLRHIEFQADWRARQANKLHTEATNK